MKQFRKDIVEKYKHPIPRQPALARKPAGPRQPALARKPVGFINDGKLHVVIDTNVIMNALKKQKTATDEACATILGLWEQGIFSLGMNHIIFEEYKLTGDSLAKHGLIDVPHFSRLMALIAERGFFHRVVVAKQHVSASYKDDHLFDGLAGDYLVSEDTKDVVCERVVTTQRNYKRIVKASEFLSEAGLV